MKADKQVLGSLEKCYAVTEIDYDGARHLVVTAEKENRRRSGKTGFCLRLPRLVRRMQNGRY